jgi:urease accessory protein
LLLLADGRLPAGGYAHSGGVEPSVETGRIHDLPSLEAFLYGRAVTSGAVAAAFAAAACEASMRDDVSRLQALDPELDARMPSPALRAASRQLGRQLALVAGRIRPDSRQSDRLGDLGRSPHQPVVLGVVCDAFGLAPRDAALAALHESAVGPATAAVRLLSLDPFASHAVLARLVARLDELATEAAEHAGADPAELPALGAPLLDIAAEHHARSEVRLFAS